MLKQSGQGKRAFAADLPTSAAGGLRPGKREPFDFAQFALIELHGRNLPAHSGWGAGHPLARPNQAIRLPATQR